MLLVTITKQGRAEDRRYLNHRVDERAFHWQSQASTSPGGKRGREIVGHRALGIQIHLFVRETKLAGGKAAPKRGPEVRAHLAGREVGRVGRPGSAAEDTRTFGRSCPAAATPPARHCGRAGTGW
ncbi:MAG: DUF3427 domain-containing protein [Thermoanaerobaculaceae bacterium]|nr:DUF3427 domain-containing protein [Thermoanaerobaculaceae bacterium]